MLFSTVLRNRSVSLLVSKVTAIKKVSLPSVTTGSPFSPRQQIAERAMAGTAQSQTSAVRTQIPQMIKCCMSRGICVSILLIVCIIASIIAQQIR